MSENRIAVLASTNATDMQAIIDAIETGALDAEISAVISNRRDSGAMERARKHRINAVFLDPLGKTREEYDMMIDEILEKEKIGLVLLIGYMRIIGSSLIEKHRNRIMNIHPSLLPAFAGGIDMNVHQAVLDRGCRYTGASLIFIDEGADTGPIISQKVVKVDEGDTPEALKKKVQRAEQELLLEAIPLFFSGRLDISERGVTVK